MKQMSLAHTGFELVTKRTRKREFLNEMNLVIPWSELLSLIAPHAPAGKTGRPPFATEVMLRIHLLQQFFGHSDPAMEEALHDIPLYQKFAFIGGKTNRVISDKTPKEYLAFFAAQSGEEGFSVQEIPLDSELLDTPAYKKFLEVRRERIANWLNLFITGEQIKTI